MASCNLFQIALNKTTPRTGFTSFPFRPWPRDLTSAISALPLLSNSSLTNTFSFVLIFGCLAPGAARVMRCAPATGAPRVLSHGQGHSGAGGCCPPSTHTPHRPFSSAAWARSRIPFNSAGFRAVRPFGLAPGAAVPPAQLRGAGRDLKWLQDGLSHSRRREQDDAGATGSQGTDWPLFSIRHMQRFLFPSSLQPGPFSRAVLVLWVFPQSEGSSGSSARPAGDRAGARCRRAPSPAAARGAGLAGQPERGSAAGLELRQTTPTHYLLNWERETLPVKVQLWKIH